MEYFKSQITSLKNSYWFISGIHEIVLSYRRSLLGPLWMVLSNFMIILTLTYIFRGSIDDSLVPYPLYLCAGYIFWSWFSNTVVDSCHVLTKHRGILLQYKFSWLNFILKTCFKNLIFLFHSLILIVLYLFFFSSTPTFYNLIVFIFNLSLILVCFIFISNILAVISLRLRDLPMLIGLFLQILFFATPIIWIKVRLGFFEPFLSYNPVNILLTLFRNPILNISISLNIYIIFFIYMFILCLTSVFIFNYSKNKLSYWL